MRDKVPVATGEIGQALGRTLKESIYKGVFTHEHAQAHKKNKKKFRWDGRFLLERSSYNREFCVIIGIIR